MTITVATFYKFVPVAEPEALRATLEAAAAARGLCGTVLVATEGINGTVAATADDLASFLKALRADVRFADIAVRTVATGALPFRRLKVKVKPEIVTFRQPVADPSQMVGTYVAPEDWNALIREPDVVVIDARNAFEVAAGTFEGAIDPRTKRFSDFAGYIDARLDEFSGRRVAMFCTGGIRCEKATAYLKQRGVEDVYHLKGGILAYLDRVPATESLWHGRCVVFDERETEGPGDAGERQGGDASEPAASAGDAP